MIKLAGSAITFYEIPEFSHPVQAGGSAPYTITHNLGSVKVLLDLKYKTASFDYINLHDLYTEPGSFYNCGFQERVYQRTSTQCFILIYRVSHEAATVSGRVYKLA